MFTVKDLNQMTAQGILPEKVIEQLDYFKTGFPYLSINRAAITGDGIMQLSLSEVRSYASEYDKSAVSAIKFVPASGAATRMFKELFEYVLEGKEAPTVTATIENIENFAFFDDLKQLGIDMSDKKTVISSIISDGLNYGNLPKGLLKFHKYNDGSRTALEEHLVEGAEYANSDGKTVQIHFTVSPEHMKNFEDCVEQTVNKYSERYNIQYVITYSVQKSSTDTIAANPDNTPFRKSDGELLFRPAGHGALLENLNDLDADIIFIKTIDNVVPDSAKSDTILYKKALAGKALSVRSKVFDYINQLNNNTSDRNEISFFIEREFGHKVLPGENLFDILNRPIRVCGMVKNEGEPGGGPFWVKDPLTDFNSLQIVESSQIAPEEKHLMMNATHFNPVDLICVTKDHKGDKFDLRKFTDPKTGFISSKTVNGKLLQAQELPGLWNGAMAQWNTILIEVPNSTFAPVKSITDLLRPEHL